eukprot:CAMPEP_0198260928 /NCGR_PEP_ID=MMETSP1447-20131203/9771_1 /TAXON_ID=420782 /ORGANISM="Chaetoceros dichaeta, Strain CCMP1751" /LENGTH=399 /DNA_ID=CAMNT_0043948695 /DNA_START=89 /DNA_END=1285 /DNA_ORIENTATION=-
MTIGLLYRSIKIYVAPCGGVLCSRLGNCLWGSFCCCCGWPFKDKDFFGAGALGDFSIGDESMETAGEMEASTDWIRAKDLSMFKSKRPKLFQGDIEPADLCQGAVGNCWLVAALACAAEFPDVIRRMFVTREYSPRGKYKVRIYDPIKKKFVKVIVDDRIPCKKGTKVPRFMSPNGHELWAIIVEKAYAKYVGSYAKLEGGFTLWGWHAITGNNVFQMSRNDDGTWFREDMVAIDDKKDKRACGFRGTKEKFTEENVWTLLKKYDKQKALMSASIGKMDHRRTDGPSGEQMLEEDGLVAGHAYSVLQAREVRYGNDKFRLLNIRNPWGTYEWKGDWSDNSRKWKKYPTISKELKFTAADDGCFWISFDDFIETYTRINICDRSTDKDASLDVNESKGSW